MAIQPLVTIIMAVKDTAPYLRDCLDSVMAQTYENWELIAVNDHSSDDSPKILKEYAAKDSRIRFFNSNQPRLIPTLQRGYREVKGSLINRMDSDDKMPDYKLQVLVEEWLKYGKGTVIAGGTEHFVDKGEVGEGFIKYENWLNEVARTSTHYREIYRECVIPSHCWLLHKEDLDAAGAFDPIVYPEDYDLCFRFYERGLNVIGIDRILHYWRDRSERISRTWEEYEDNRYFDLKLRFFYELDRDNSRPLVLWGAGRNGKDMAKLLQSYDDKFHWVCDNRRKIGKDIYGVRLEHYKEIMTMEDPQIMVVVASPEGKKEIEQKLAAWDKNPVIDFWFFA
ncbi:glycosyltransferase family 2 protein [Salinimicrobium sediminilitoris]|uniref:glycosyltransferase family 2 protein n=1 Tax=Salinimicrobium sediminilitoris TaxID=2876715 RepID=UPI001E424CC0|nr:glycosyltransferase [Salinimicrobium sediminilitoris]MCC8361112.1 glycosyltransferase [Salinimicrobium sediminilitoris]